MANSNLKGSLCIFRNILLSLIIFFSSSFLIKKFLLFHQKDLSYIPLVSEKLEHFKANKDNYDVLFIGSSRVYRQVDPVLFDARLSQQGHNIQTFNFGFYGMKMPETYFWLEKIIDLQPKNLKWIVIEANLDNVYENLDNARNNRVMYWHTPKHTANTIKYIAGSDDSLPRKLVSVYSHIIPFFYNSINLGDFSKIFLSSTGLSQHQISEASYSNYLGESLSGYKALDDESGQGYKITNKKFRENFNAFQQQVVRFEKAIENDTVALDPSRRELIRQFTDLVESSGATPMFIIPPKLKTEAHVLRLYQDGHIDSLLAYNDPEKYADFYELEYRFDRAHLNKKGAEEFTRLIAEDFEQYIESVDRR